MSKEDIIYVYFCGGIVTHDLDELKEEVRREADFLFNQELPEKKEVFVHINVEREEVGKYIWSNQYNLSNEEAEALAKEHSFNLSEINWENRDFACKK